MNSFDETEVTKSFGNFSPMKNYIKPPSINDYVLLDKIGSGAQGSVWKARDQTGKVVALKLIKLKQGRTQNLEEADKEVDALIKLSTPSCDPYIICYYNSFYDAEEQVYVIVMEYIEGETLSIYSSNMRALANIRDPSKWSTLYRHLLLITKDIIDAFIYMNSKGILHNDIKGGNIMIDTIMTPKLIDFGISCMAGRCNISNKMCCSGFGGTPYYVPPEVIENQTRYATSDIWSLGVTLYKSATGSYPFNYPMGRRLPIGDILSYTRDYIPNKLETSNELLNQIVNRSLNKDPFTRISSYDISNLLEDL